MPSIIQTALFVEGVGNIPAIIALTFFPSETLSKFFIPPTSTYSITPTTTLLTRFAGVFIAALTPQLLLAYSDSPCRVEKRKLAYYTLGSAEVFFIPLLLWEAFRATDAEKTIQGGGLSQKAGLISAASLVGLLSWRICACRLRPEWLDGVQKVSEPKGRSEGKNK